MDVSRDIVTQHVTERPVLEGFARVKIARDMTVEIELKGGTVIDLPEFEAFSLCATRKAIPWEKK